LRPSLSGQVFPAKRTRLAHQRARLNAGLLSSYVDPGKRMNESKNVQEPHNHADHHNSIQDGFDRPAIGMKLLTSQSKTPTAIRTISI
jgi:hypothetical protein